MKRATLQRISAVMAGAAIVFCGACSKPAPVKSDLVAAWVHTWYGATRVERLSPPVASRAIAYAATALYAGMAAVDTAMPVLDGALHDISKLPRSSQPADFDATLAAVAAERVVMDSIWAEALPSTRAAIARLADSLVADRKAAGVSSNVAVRSDSLGRVVGLAVLDWAKGDGFAGTRGRAYPPPEGRGVWYNDSPGNVYTTQNLSGASEYIALDNPANQLRAGNSSDRGLIMSRPKNSKLLPAANMAGATEPYWREVRTFILQKWDQCPVAPAPVYAEEDTSFIYKNAKMVFDTQIALTDEQRTIAYYWADNPGETGTPTGHWLSIASQMISEHHLDGPSAARVVLATAATQADAFIAAWGYKYRDVVIRPRTYIRRLIDPKWEPLIPTPPFPEHPAGHSTQSAAAATVLTAFLGSEPFTDSTSIPIGHKVRKFDNFMAAAMEAGQSRIYGGIHFPSGNMGGRDLGTCIGNATIKAFSVKPINSSATK